MDTACRVVAELSPSDGARFDPNKTRSNKPHEPHTTSAPQHLEPDIVTSDSTDQTKPSGAKSPASIGQFCVDDSWTFSRYDRKPVILGHTGRTPRSSWAGLRSRVTNGPGCRWGSGPNRARHTCARIEPQRQPGHLRAGPVAQDQRKLN